MGLRSERHQVRKHRLKMQIAFGSLGVLMITGLALLAVTGEEPRLKAQRPSLEPSAGGRPETDIVLPPLMLALAAQPEKDRHSVVLLAVDKKRGRLVGIFFPENTRLNVPGFGWTGASQAMGLAGVNGVVAAVENTLSLRIPGYFYFTLAPGERLETKDFRRLPQLVKHTNLSPAELRNLGRGLPKLSVASIELPTLAVGSGGRPARQPDVRSAGELLAAVARTQPEKRPQVLILNGNGAPGMGLTLGLTLVREGYSVVGAGNAKDAAGRDDFSRAESEVISYVREASPVARVHRLLGVGKIAVQPAEERPPADIVVILGRDYLERIGKTADTGSEPKSLSP